MLVQETSRRFLAILFATIQCSFLFFLTAPELLAQKPEILAQKKEEAEEPEFTVQEYNELRDAYGGRPINRGNSGFFVPPGKGFPNDWLYRPRDRPKIGWFSIQYLDDYADGIIPTITPGMLKPLADEPRVTGLKLSSQVGLPCRNCPDRIAFGDEVLRDLPLLDHVKCLYMHEVDLTNPKRVRYLRDMEKLDWLTVKYCGVGLKSFFNDIGSLPELETLIIAPGGATIVLGKKGPVVKGDDITIADIEAFAKKVPKLKVLKIAESIDTPIKSDTILAFAKLKNLKLLVISHAAGRDYRKHTEAHNKFFFKNVIDPFKVALPTCKVQMSALALDLSGTGLPSLKRSKRKRP